MENMISYKSFHKLMVFIRKHNKKLNKFLNKISDSMLSDYEDEILNIIDITELVNALEEIMDDTQNWISHYVFECDCDYDDPCSVWFDSEGNKHIIDGDMDLYNLITEVYGASDEKLTPVYCLTEKGKEYLKEGR